METKTPIVEIKHLNKSYRRGTRAIPVLVDITLDIVEGEFLALMGPSGSGKTTLLNMIAALDQADSGIIRVGGMDITGLTETQLAAWRSVNVGFIFQFYNLIPVLTAFENVELPLLLTGISRRERREHVELALQVVNLTGRMDHYPAQLSGGEQQRVAIARAIINEPLVLLADEPTGNLDPDITREIMVLFRSINMRGTTVVIATHNKELLRNTEQRIVVLNRGRILQ